jgi:hypothetical protein
MERLTMKLSLFSYFAVYKSTYPRFTISTLNLRFGLVERSVGAGFRLV